MRATERRILRYVALFVLLTAIVIRIVQGRVRAVKRALASVDRPQAGAQAQKFLLIKQKILLICRGF
jgi:hypothetical protein